MAVNHTQIHQDVGISFLLFNFFILMPCSVYFTYKFYSYMHRNLVILKRRPRLVLAGCLLSIAHIYICKSLVLLIAIDVLLGLVESLARPKAILAVADAANLRRTLFLVTALMLCVNLGTHLFSILPLHLITLRFYLLFFDLMWYRSVQNDQWQSVLDARSHSMDWFLQNRSDQCFLVFKVSNSVTCIMSTN